MRTYLHTSRYDAILKGSRMLRPEMQALMDLKCLNAVVNAVKELNGSLMVKTDGQKL
jgi:hypothetical protein